MRPVQEEGTFPKTTTKKPGNEEKRLQAQVVIVKENDRLSGIVLKRYGKVNDRILSFVKKANPEIQDVNYIEAGWKITLPELSDTCTMKEVRYE